MDQYELSFVPSSYLLREGVAADLSRLLVVSHPGVSGTRGHIPFVQLEVGEVQALAGGGQHLSGEKLTPRSLWTGLAKSTAAHFACHGYFDWEHPYASGLVLPQGNWLTVQDILTKGTLAHLSLAVLSACDVGLDLPRPGDENVGLVRGLMASGVDHVVASLWPAADLSTMLLMSRFYQALSGNLPEVPARVSSALRAAQQWLRALPAVDAASLLEQRATSLLLHGQPELAVRVLARRHAILERGAERPFADVRFWGGLQVHSVVLERIPSEPPACG